MEATAILQRTSLGLETIKTKSVRLTQSERLILIVVDGVTPYATLREKVWALSTERFTHALKTLLARDLIFEVLLPDEAQQPEELDSSVVDHFLQQDPLDPVTIISVDPEDHFGMDLIMEMGHGVPSPANAPPVKALALPAEADVSGARSIAPPPCSDKPEDKPIPASATQTDLEPIKPADAVLWLQKNTPTSGVQAIPPRAKPAVQPSIRPDHSKTVSSPAPRAAATSESPRKPPPSPPTKDRRDAKREVSVNTASRKQSHNFSGKSNTAAPKKRPVDILKLCSWTGVLSGFGILLLLLLQRYGTLS